VVEPSRRRNRPAEVSTRLPTVVPWFDSMNSRGVPVGSPSIRRRKLTYRSFVAVKTSST
jgi:hypothetical protein